jgi:hypothetical protein
MKPVYMCTPIAGRAALVPEGVGALSVAESEAPEPSVGADPESDPVAGVGVVAGLGTSCVIKRRGEFKGALRLGGASGADRLDGGSGDIELEGLSENGI